jgi:hypothetical protein
MVTINEIRRNGIVTEYSLAEAMGRFISEDPIGLAGNSTLSPAIC